MNNVSPKLMKQVEHLEQKRKAFAPREHESATAPA